MPGGNTRKQAEKLLEIELPPDISNLRFYHWKPSPDLRFFTAYIKFDCGPKEFEEIVSRLCLLPAGAKGAAHLPASWEGPGGVSLDWWNPTRDTPPDAAARSYGVSGWIVAKLEGGSGFVIVTDSGQTGGTPGPW